MGTTPRPFFPVKKKQTIPPLRQLPFRSKQKDKNHAAVFLFPAACFRSNPMRTTESGDFFPHAPDILLLRRMQSLTGTRQRSFFLKNEIRYLQFIFFSFFCQLYL